MKECPYCRKEIEKDSVFCIYCGKKVITERINNQTQVDKKRNEGVLVDSNSPKTVSSKATEDKSANLYGCYFMAVLFVILLMLSFCS